LATTDAFRIQNLFSEVPDRWDPISCVLCDVFKKKNVNLLDGKTAKAGAPILYYRAHSSGTTIQDIYHSTDNSGLIMIMGQDNGVEHPLWNPNVFYSIENGVADPRASSVLADNYWPYRPDSYILISAGADGLYGTADDIHNFGN